MYTHKPYLHSRAFDITPIDRHEVVSFQRKEVCNAQPRLTRGVHIVYWMYRL